MSALSIADLRGFLLATLAWVVASVPLAAYSQSPELIFNYTRTSAFTYYPNGQLWTERVEPDIPSLCVLSTYEYDEWGNRDKATTANCAGATGDALFTARSGTQTWTRSAMPTFTVPGVGAVLALQRGQFPLDSSNALNHASTQSFDPRFGVPTRVVDANNLVTSAVYDELGRKTQETKPDGTGVLWRYCIISGRGLDTSSNSSGCSGSLEYAPDDAIQYVQSWPIDTSGVKSGRWSMVFTDRMGRSIRTASQGFDGSEQSASLRGQTIVRDTVYNTAGASVMETQPYWHATGSSRNIDIDPESNNVGVTRVELDALGRPLRVYTADADASRTTPVAFGSGTFGHGAYGSRLATLTSYAYAGGKTTVTNDLGKTSSQETNPIGELVRTTDAYGAQVVMQNDAFGNLRSTRDPLGNVTTVSVDIRGRKISLRDPDAGYTTYGYNALGELVWQQNQWQRGLTPATQTTFKYDVLGRKTSQVDDEYTSTWYYDRDAAGSAGSGSTVCLKGMLCESVTSHGVRKRYWSDSVGRPVSERLDVTNGVSMAQSRTWDAATSRLVTRTWPSGLQLRYDYTPLGYLRQLSLPQSMRIEPLPAVAGGTPEPDVVWAAGKVIWRAQSINAWDLPEAHANSGSTDINALNTRITYKAHTAQQIRRVVGTEALGGVLNHTYTWDSLGRMDSRTDFNGDASYGDDVTETFVYDNIHRLVSYKVAGVDVPNLQRTVNLTYNAIGLLLKRSDVGSYTYPAVVEGTATVRPHAVQSLVTNSGATTNYTYNAVGNLISADAGKYRNLKYTSFNQPDSELGARGPSNSPKHTWQYDEQHARIKETLTVVGGTKAGTQTTWRWHPGNAGALDFEYELNAPTTHSAANPATQQSRHFISAAGQVVVVLATDTVLPTLASSAKAPTVLTTQVVLRKVEGWHVDHLGSLVATTNHAGAVTQRYSFDPFGQRRQPTGAADPGQTLEFDWSLATSGGTGHGFTAHQHLDDIGLIHMNGRLFDPRMGAFLQPDPFVQDPSNLQNYHRYAYCMASPMACTDPSGYFLKWIGRKIKAEWKRSAIFRTVAAIAVAWVVGPGYDLFSLGPGFTQSAVAGFASGAVASGNMQGALQGAFTGAVFFGAGNVVGGGNFFTGGGSAQIGDWSAIAVHGVAGCVTSAAGGGKCGEGALSAAFSKYANVSNIVPKNEIGGLIVSAAVGGTASVLGGGKFENGATTAAYGYLFNCVAHKCSGADYDPKDPNFHEYGPFASSICDTAAAGCLDAARQQLLCNSAPGQAACVAVGEEISQELSGGNSITQYAPSPDMVINGTSPGHVFDDGYVVRWLSVNDAGIAQIWTYGRGVNTSLWTTVANQYGGNAIFKLIGLRNSAKANKQITKDGNGP